MSLHRRDFVKSIGSLAALAGLRGLPAAAGISVPGTNVGKRIICLIMRGGYDGLSLVIPNSTGLPPLYNAYQAVRPNIHYVTGTQHDSVNQEARALDANWSVHPAMAEFESEWMGTNNLAIVHRTGYPVPNKSHFTSIDVWGSMRRDIGQQGTGWIGRLGANVPMVNPTGAMGMGTGNILDFRHPNFDALVFKTVDSFKIAEVTNQPIDPAFRTQQMRAIEAAVSSNKPLIDQWHQTAESAFLLSDVILDDVASYNPGGTDYGYINSPANPSGTAFSNAVRDIARMIHANRTSVSQYNYDTKVYCALFGGWDTHQDQKATLYPQWSTVNQTIAALKADLMAQGEWDDTVVMLFTEFGRRNDENTSNPPGTDHGHGNVAAVWGPNIIGGHYGVQPTPADFSLPEMTQGADFRQMFYELLRDHLGFNATLLDNEIGEPTGPNMWTPATPLQPLAHNLHICHP